MVRVPHDLDEPEQHIVPEPDAAVRAAIRRALAEPAQGLDGWAEAALVEGVSGADADALNQHDVCSLW